MDDVTFRALEAMAQMFEAMVNRIETLERRLDEACECKLLDSDNEPLLVDYAEMHK